MKKLIIIKMLVPPKLIYKFNTIGIPTECLIEHEKLDLKYISRSKGPKESRHI